eukprot:3481740-Karenia_brevis.AAC.1
MTGGSKGGILPGVRGTLSLREGLPPPQVGKSTVLFTVQSREVERGGVLKLSWHPLNKSLQTSLSMQPGGREGVL